MITQANVIKINGAVIIPSKNISTACEDNKAQAVESFNVYILVGRGQI